VRFDLRSVAGLFRTGMAGGALLASALIAVRVGQALTRPLTAPPTSEVARAGAPPPADLLERHLQCPVSGLPADVMDSFNDPRSGERIHQAVDIMAPRGTPVVAVDDGTVVKLHRSGAGGISVYQFDTERRYGYYYAHLDGYAPGLGEGQAVRRGDVLGFVGTTGNAPEGAPHLHFAVFRVASPEQWWGGQPINPYPLWR